MPVTQTITEVVSSRTPPSNSRPVSGDFGFYSVLETPETTVDATTLVKFREAFAFDEKESVLGSKFF